MIWTHLLALSVGGIVGYWLAAKARASGAISKLGSDLEVKTVSKPGAVLKVKAVPIPPKIQSMMAEAIRGKRR